MYVVSSINYFRELYTANLRPLAPAPPNRIASWSHRPADKDSTSGRNCAPGSVDRIGTKLIPKLRSGTKLEIGVECAVTLDSAPTQNLEAEIRQILDDLGLKDKIRLEK